MLKRKGKNVLASDLWENLQFHRSPKLDINLNSDFVNRHNFDSTISIKSKPLQQSRDLDNDLPDGSCFSRVLRMDSNQQTEFFLKSTVRECQYIGSFPVSGEDNNSRAEFVRVQLDQIKERIRKKDVLLVISLTGLKVYNPDGKSVLMAHALRRISFATCDPDNNQFSFLAREPNSHFSHQYCHSFLAANAIEMQRLSQCCLPVDWEQNGCDWLRGADIGLVGDWFEVLGLLQVIRAVVTHPIADIDLVAEEVRSAGFIQGFFASVSQFVMGSL